MLTTPTINQTPPMTTTPQPRTGHIYEVKSPLLTVWMCPQPAWEAGRGAGTCYRPSGRPRRYFVSKNAHSPNLAGNTGNTCTPITPRRAEWMCQYPMNPLPRPIHLYGTGGDGHGWGTSRPVHVRTPHPHPARGRLVTGLRIQANGSYPVALHRSLCRQGTSVVVGACHPSSSQD